MSDDAFDWGSLSEKFWRDTGAEIGCNEKQIKFAAAKHRGATNSLAAKEAGYGQGSDEALRSEGYRVFRSNKVQALLSLAAAEEGGKSAGDITEAEARTILSKLARGSDPAIKIKALESIGKMDAAAASGEVEQYLRRPDRYIAEWLGHFPSHYNVLVAGLMAFLPGDSKKIGLGTSNFIIVPLASALAPHLAHHWPEVWQKLVADFARDGADIAEFANKPLRPIEEIIKRVMQGGDGLRVDLRSNEQLNAYPPNAFSKRADGNAAQ